MTAQCSVDILHHIININPIFDPFLSEIDLSVHFFKIDLPKFTVLLEDVYTPPGQCCNFVDETYAFSIEVGEELNRSQGEEEHEFDVCLCLVFLVFGQEFFDKW